MNSDNFTTLKDSRCYTAVRIEYYLVIISVLFCPECTALSQMKLLLESNAVKDIHNTAQLQEFTSIISHQHATEICCVCQASIL